LQQYWADRAAGGGARPRARGIGQHGGQQLGQIIGRDGHRRGRGRGAAAGFPQADRGGRGGQLEQAQGPAADRGGQQLGGHHPAQLLTDRGGGGAAIPAGAGSGGRGGGLGLGQPGSGGGLQLEEIGPAGGGGVWHRQGSAGPPRLAPCCRPGAGPPRPFHSSKDRNGKPGQRPAAQAGKPGRVVSVTAAGDVSYRRPGRRLPPQADRLTFPDGTQKPGGERVRAVMGRAWGSS